MIIGGVREIDKNGRVQIPSEIRELMKMDDHKLNVYYENGKCIIETIPKRLTCSICGIFIYEGMYCSKCMDKYIKKGE